MRNWSRILIVLLVTASLFGCGGDKKPATPKETFMTYIKAIKAKDTTTMKLLLSSETIKMHEREAKANGSTVDDIVKRQTLFNEKDREVVFRDEKINGEKATIEIKTSGGTWQKVPFVFEEGAWKIDNAGAANQIQQEIEDENRKFNDLINGGTHMPGQSPPVPQPTPNF